MALMLVIGWVALIPLAAQNMLFCMLIRNAAVVSILSILCGLGTVAGTIEAVTRLFGIHIAQFFPPYLVMMAPYISGSTSTGSPPFSGRRPGRTGYKPVPVCVCQPFVDHVLYLAF